MRLPLAISLLTILISLPLSLPGQIIDPWLPPEAYGPSRRTVTFEQTGNLVVDWNRLMLDTFRVEREWPPSATRAMAIMHIALFDAVNSIDPIAEPYLSQFDDVTTASAKAAAASAAHRVLTNLYPDQSTAFDAALDQSLFMVPDGPAKHLGLDVGMLSADAILAERSDDGSSETIVDVGENETGVWRPTRPGFRPGLMPQWATLRPFVMQSPEQFRTPGPPPINSQKYIDDYNEVKELGEYFDSTRTVEQTEIALFWADNPGTWLPPGHWNHIAGTVTLEEDLSLPRSAHIFALLNIALGDAAISAWEGKYYYDFWRPITAINLGDSDGVQETVGDTQWTPRVITPPFPEYPSGHAVFSGTAASVLTHYFGEDYAFSDQSDGLPENFGVPDVIREFNSFEHAATEAARSRIYGGIHFPSADHDGLESGQALAEYVRENVLLPLPQEQHWTIR